MLFRSRGRGGARATYGPDKYIAVRDAQRKREHGLYLAKTVWAILLDICRDKLAIGHSAGASPRRDRDNPLVVRTVEAHTCR